MPIYKDGKQVVEESEEGSSIISWSRNKVDVLYPGQKGGIQVCFPDFGPVDEELGISHDPLRASCEIRTSIDFEPGGFAYRLKVRVRDEDASKGVFVSPGFRAYFRTPQQEATILWPWVQTVDTEELAPCHNPIDRDVLVSIPKAGIVQMKLLGDGWEEEESPKAVLCRDSEEYLGLGLGFYESSCARLTSEWKEFSCRFAFFSSERRGK